jgi:hypothetical protein
LKKENMMHREARKQRSCWVNAQGFDGSAGSRHVVVVTLEIKARENALTARGGRDERMTEAREQEVEEKHGGHWKRKLLQWMLRGKK